MNVLRKVLGTKRGQSVVHRGPFNRLLPIWQALVISLVFDPALVYLVPKKLSLASASAVAIICALYAIPFTDQQRIHRGLSKLRRFHKTNLKDRSTLFPIAVIFLTLTAFAVKSAILLETTNVISTVVIIALGAYMIGHVKQTLREDELDRKQLTEDPVSHMKRWEQQVIIACLVPLLAARIIGVCGALCAARGEITPAFVIFLITSFAFLLMLKPQRAHFLGLCSKCKHPVPIVLSDLGCCMHCDQQLRDGIRG